MSVCKRYVVWWQWNFHAYRDGGSTGCVYEHDTALFMDMFPEPENTYIGNFSDLPPKTGAIVVVNGARADSSYIPALQKFIKDMPWVVVFSMQDDNSILRLHELKHPNMKIWVHSPKCGGAGFEWSQNNHDYARRIPVGTTKLFRNLSPEQRATPKTIDWLFIGRLGFSTRVEWFVALRDLVGNKFTDTGTLNERRIWTQDGCTEEWVTEEKYVNMMLAAKVVICRPASCTPETGRLYEALEAGCVPIVARCATGDWNQKYNWQAYWPYVFGEIPPFPIIDGPRDLARGIQEALNEYPENANRIQIWWADYKIRLAKQLHDEVNLLCEHC